MIMNINIKTLLLSCGLFIVVAAFCHSIMSDINVLSLRVKSLQTENNCIRKRLDLIDKEASDVSKRIWIMKNEK